MIGRWFQLIVLLVCVGSNAYSGERLGVQAITDLSVLNSGLPYSGGTSPDSQTNLNGQLVLLGTFRITDRFSFSYEGRLSHQEGLAGSDPRIQQTRTSPVVQGYVRYDLPLSWSLSLQAGKFGHPFGQFLSRNYANENPLIGFPLVYTHRTTLRSNYLPYGPTDLVNYRYRQRAPEAYGLGSVNSWLPLLGYSYPTGLMAFGSSSRLDYRIAVINSSLSNPLDLGEPGQRIQWTAGGGWNCLTGLRLGTSYAEGPFLDAQTIPHLPTGTNLRDFPQRALGFDVQYTLNHLEFYGELIFNQYRVPYIQQRLGATGYYLELKRTWTPRIFTAVRWNQIYFDRFRYGAGNQTAYSQQIEPVSEASYLGVRWDENVNSLEAGLGYRLTEKLLAKASYQYNRTVAGNDPKDNVFAVQLVYSFDVRSLLRVR
jgi:hypothetical protein